MKLLLTVMLCLFSCVCILGIEEVRARTWFVRPMGSVIELPYDGTSRDNAFNGLAGVVWGENGVKAGDTLKLCRKYGDSQYFTRTLVIKGSGTRELPIIIESELPEAPAIIISEKQINFPAMEGYNPAIKKGSGNNAVGGKDVQNVIIRNLKIERCGGVRFRDSTNILIHNIQMSNVYSGITFIGGENNIIQHCNITNFIDSGIALIGSDPQTTIPVKNCVIENNKCSFSKSGDGITLHRSNDGNGYDIGSNNKVVNNICFNNSEEGLDITSGRNTLVEGNRTFGNSRSAVIWHGAEDVIFIRNYSSDEAGLLIGPEVGKATVAYNIIDSGNKSALIINRGQEYKIYNNTLLSSGFGIKPATVDIRGSAGDIDFRNNIIIATESRGYLLRVANGTPEDKNVRFRNNIWWQPQGKKAVAYYDKQKKSYNFSRFQGYSTILDTNFADPALHNKYTPTNISDIMDIGDTISDDWYLSKDYVGTITPQGNGRDIGAVEIVQ